ncbi:MAG TPA: zinc-binding dehydrogenase [Bacillales bacterium]|nr:zinc-binding dehydrogenase [Bacillales bacterium]
MKAVVVTRFGGLEGMKFEEVERPKVGNNQVLIRVAAAAVNFADIKSRKGKFHGGLRPPFIPGLDAAGTVEAIGAHVTSVKVGQRVIAFPTTGSYAEYTVANENLTFPIADTVDFEVAAASPLVSFTSFQLLSEVGRLKKGENVVIHSAAGGVGTTAIQTAKILGAGLIIGTVSRDEKKETVLKAGADVVLNYEKEDIVKKILHYTDGHGGDVILDSIAAEIGEKSMECLAMYGRLVNFGNAGGRPVQFQSTDLHSTCRSVLGFSLGTTIKRRPEIVRQTAEQVLPYLADGRLNIVIGRKLPLEEARAAHDWIESRRSTGKVILVP